MSGNAARYRLADGVGTLSLGFISSRFLAYWRYWFFTVGLIAVVLLAVVLHKVRVPVMLGASVTHESARLH